MQASSGAGWKRSAPAYDLRVPACMTPQPQIAIDRDSVSRPMTLGLRTIDMVYLPLQRLNGALILALRVC